MKTKPSHILVAKTGEKENGKDYTQRVGAAWTTEGNAMFIKVDMPITLIPGRDDFRLVPNTYEKPSAQ